MKLIYHISFVLKEHKLTLGAQIAKSAPVPDQIRESFGFLYLIMLNIVVVNTKNDINWEVDSGKIRITERKTLEL